MGFQAAELKRMHKEFNEEVVKEINQLNEFEHIISFIGKDGLPAYYLDKIFKGSGPAHVAVRKLEKKTGSKRYSVMKYPPAKGKSEFDKKKRDFKKEDIQVEEVDNSLMAQATRVISQTSIKEKIDPADVDNIATADDRKAADKNIIIQLRRAQDMQGKADVTFKDKPNKKEKIDIRVINKALDMFDKMRPNDKAKMQTTIGKSYRDLLKTVQRGRV